MICWKHLNPRNKCCGDDDCLDDEYRAEFFKALVGANMSNAASNGESSACIAAAQNAMSEIERRVEAGTLWKEVGREEGA